MRTDSALVVCRNYYVKFAAKTPQVGRRFYWPSAAAEPPEKRVVKMNRTGPKPIGCLRHLINVAGYRLLPVMEVFFMFGVQWSLIMTLNLAQTNEYNSTQSIELAII